jgi:hypothetical protein
MHFALAYFLAAASTLSAQVIACTGTQFPGISNIGFMSQLGQNVA